MKKTSLVFLLFVSTGAAIMVGWLGVRTSRPAHDTSYIPAATTPTPRTRPLEVRGSIPYWDQIRAATSFKDNSSVFQYISLFWYYLTEEGDIKRYQQAKEDASIIDFAHASGVTVTIVITNLPEEDGTTWDSHRVEHVLGEEEMRAYHIGEITEKLAEFALDGVTIDYEEVAEDQREKFSLFIGELATALHKRNKTVGVALHPKTGEEKDAQDFQDWQTLSQFADQLYIMAYGEHWDEGPPGPIASYDWVKQIVNYAQKSKVPSEKLYLGIPLYGYDWAFDSERKAVGLTYTDVQQLLQRYNVAELWNEPLRSPYFRYEKNGKTHEVWFENAASVKDKVTLAEKAGFAGVTFWRLGGEDPGVWKIFDSLKP